jgi:hypothetical protein
MRESSSDPEADEATCARAEHAAVRRVGSVGFDAIVP